MTTEALAPTTTQIQAGGRQVRLEEVPPGMVIEMQMLLLLLLPTLSLLLQLLPSPQRLSVPWQSPL